MVEDDEEQMKEELKEAFRIYDKEVSKKSTCWLCGMGTGGRGKRDDVKL